MGVDPKNQDILIVEDQAISSLYYTSLVQGFGYGVVVAQNGISALEMIKDNDRIVLVLMDLDLGKGMDGAETAQKILGLKSLPIIFLTAHQEEHFLERARSVQHYGYITKKCGAYVLESAIATALQLSSAYRDLQKTQERNIFAMEATNDGIFDLDITTKEMYYSPAYYTMLGYEVGGFPRTSWEWEKRLHPDDREMALRTSNDSTEGTKDNFKMEYRLQAKSGDYRWILGQGKVIARGADGKALRVVGTHRDITERKEKEAKIAALLSEKELILREVHHRVKNNMNAISSLLSLQSDASKNPDGAWALTEAANRVQAMIVLYEKLYQSSYYETLPVDDYLSELVDRIAATFPHDDSITVVKDIGHFEVHHKAMSDLGIIMNELLTNAFKYAFNGGSPERTKKTIWVRAARKEHGALFEVADNGVGMDPKLLAASPGFGFTLVNALTQQLKGDLRVETAAGTRFVLELPLAKSSEPLLEKLRPKG
jgi:PAS domain S-box-containing protein